MNVPAAIAMKTPERSFEEPENIQPKAIPKGLAEPNIKIIEYACNFSTSAFAKHTPSVIASTHLCRRIAIVKLMAPATLVYTPIANPSKVPCKDSAINRRYGVRADYILS